MKRILLLVLVGVFLWGGSAGADVIYQNSWDGLDLYNDPNVIYPGQTPVLNGNSLLFNSGSMKFENLFIVPLISTGTLSSTATTTISVSANLTRLTADSSSRGIQDFDPNLLIGDGNYWAGMATDEDGTLNQGRSVAFEISYSKSAWDSTELTPAGGQYPLIGESADWSYSMTLNESLTSISTTFGGQTGSAYYTTILAPTNALEFAFAGNNLTENYQINALNIQIDGTPAPVPEPTTMLLFGTGLIGLVGSRRRKSKKA